MSLVVRPARPRAFGMASVGAVVNISGSCGREKRGEAERGRGREERERMERVPVQHQQKPIFSRAL